MRAIKILITFLSVTFFALSAGAQDYPTKPVKLIIPFTPGSVTDVIGRTVGQELSQIWDTQMVFENHPGAGCTLGTALVAKAPTDGYTLLISAVHAASPAFYSKLPYDPLKDFIGIVPLASQPIALVVGSSTGIKSVSELIAMAKAKPGDIKFGSPGTGSISHLAAEKFKSEAGIDAIHVSSKGGPETIKATNKGSVTYSFLPIALAMKGIKEGKLHALGVTSSQRVKELPDVPTIAESGIAGFERIAWWGIWVPAGTPSNITSILENDISKALTSQGVLQKFEKKMLKPMNMSSVEFSKFILNEMDSIAHIVEGAGIKPE